MMTKVWPRIRITGVCRQVAGAVLMVLGGAVLPNTLSASEQGGDARTVCITSARQ
jgi:hypothetical protein